MSQKLTIEQIAEAMQKNKWHLLEIENIIQETNYGKVRFELDIRLGKVEKIFYEQSKVLLAPKQELQKEFKENTKQDTSHFNI